MSKIRTRPLRQAERVYRAAGEAGVRVPAEAVGIPMILAGDEFAEEHDLFDIRGNVSHEGGKQIDPVNFSRVDVDKNQWRRNVLAREAVDRAEEDTSRVEGERDQVSPRRLHAGSAGSRVAAER